MSKWATCLPEFAVNTSFQSNKKLLRRLKAALHVHLNSNSEAGDRVLGILVSIQTDHATYLAQ